MPLPARRALPILRGLLALVVLVGVARITLFTVYRVSGASMQDALEDGDRILVFDAHWLLDAPEPGDTIIANVEGEVLVKRVAAGPGDRVGILYGTLVRNGEVVSEDIPARRRRVESLDEHALGDDEYFLLGDHRKVSVDSRDFGPVSGQQILGRVLLRMSSGGVETVRALTKG